nr:hypothetical protein [uncultured Brevundimonas sp.]
MKHGFFNTKMWLEARISLAFTDATTSSDPSSPDYRSLMIENIETARQWGAEIAKDDTPSTLIEFVTDDEGLIQEALEFINANDQNSTMRTFNLVYPNDKLHYVVVRIREENAAVLFKTFFSGRDIS